MMFRSFILALCLTAFAPSANAQALAVGQTQNWIGGACPTGTGSSVGMAAQLTNAMPDSSILVTSIYQHGVFRMMGANVQPFLGNCTAGNSGDGGLALNAQVNQPYACWSDSMLNAFCTDSLSGSVREKNWGMQTAATVASGLNFPRGITGDANWLYVIEQGAQRIVKFPLTACEQGNCGTASVVYMGAPFSGPSGIDHLADGRLLIADSSAGKVFSLVPGGSPVVFAGGGTVFQDAVPATQTRLIMAASVTVDPNTQDVYIGDSGNNRVRKVDHATGLIWTVAGTGKMSGSPLCPANTPCDALSIDLPGVTGVSVTPDHTLYYVVPNGTANSVVYKQALGASVITPVATSTIAPPATLTATASPVPTTTVPPPPTLTATKTPVECPVGCIPAS